MKRFVIVLAVLMLLPLNAFALQPMNDANMDQITGQAGVSIAIDDAIIYQNIEYIRYTDVGGTDGTDGSVNISNLYMMVNINAITSLDADGLPESPNRAVQGVWDNGSGTPLFNYNNVDAQIWTDANDDGIVDPTELTAGEDGINDHFEAKALTIDVGTLAVLTAGAVNNTGNAAARMAGVRIGLPTMEVNQTALTFDVTITAAGALNGGGTGMPLSNSYGRISIGNMTMGVLDGVVEIAPH